MREAAVLLLLGTMLAALAPSGGGERMRRSVALLAALSVLLAFAEAAAEAAGPLRALPDRLREILVPDTETTAAYAAEARARTAADGIRRAEAGAACLIAARFGVPPGQITVTIDSALSPDGTLTVREAAVTHPPGVDGAAVEAFARGILGCPCRAQEGGEYHEALAEALADPAGE